MLNFAQYTVTVNASSNEVAVIREAIEACGLYIFHLDGCQKIGDSTFKCFGCFIKQGKQGK